MEKRIYPWLMSAALSLILFFCTLFAFPMVFVLAMLTMGGGDGEFISCAIITALLGITAGLTVHSKNDFGYGFRHCIVVFTILTILCCLNPINPMNVEFLTDMCLPDVAVAILKGRLASSLFFSVTITAVSVLTLAFPILVKRLKKRLKERNYY